MPTRRPRRNREGILRLTLEELLERCGPIRRALSWEEVRGVVAQRGERAVLSVVIEDRPRVPRYVAVAGAHLVNVIGWYELERAAVEAVVVPDEWLGVLDLAPVAGRSFRRP